MAARARAMFETLTPGTRVFIPYSCPCLTPQSHTGTIIGPDKWDGYYIVRLDQPAQYLEADGRVTELAEIREAEDNMQVLSD